MADRRCIKCESTSDEGKFKLKVYCENCWRNNNNDELSRYEFVFSWELFQLKYPSPWGSWCGIKATSDKKALFEAGKDKLEDLMVETDAGKKKMEQAGNTSLDSYKSLEADAKQIQEQLTKILYYKK